MVEQMEKWKKIEDYPNYEISDMGRIRNRKTLLIRKLNSSYGLYLLICLYNEKGKKLLSVHRLVAKAFVPNPLGKPQINHIDGNMRNNCANNLEWTTQKENVRHAIKTGLISQKQIDKSVNAMKTKNSKPLLQIKDGTIVARFDSVREASRKLHFSTGALSMCANGKYKKMYGYEWRYE